MLGFAFVQPLCANLRENHAYHTSGPTRLGLIRFGIIKMIFEVQLCQLTLPTVEQTPPL